MNTFTSSLLSECNRYEKVVSFLQEVQFEFFYSIYNYNCNAYNFNEIAPCLLSCFVGGTVFGKVLSGVGCWGSSVGKCVSG